MTLNSRKHSSCVFAYELLRVLLLMQIAHKICSVPIIFSPNGEHAFSGENNYPIEAYCNPRGEF